MKVIKEPQKPKVSWTKQVICPMCGATLEYTNLDVQERHLRYTDLENTITCGYCHKWFCV